MIIPLLVIELKADNLDDNGLTEINAKMILKFVSSTSAVGVKILLAFGGCALRQVNAMSFVRIFTWRYDRSSKLTTNKISNLSERHPIKSKCYRKDSH